MLAQAFPTSRGINVFISLVPPGERSLRRSLVEALSPLSRRGLINLWSDDEIQGGHRSAEEVARQLQAAQIILLLVSPACMDSPDWNQQMDAILAREKSARVSVVPVLLRPTVDWQGAPFGHLAPLPADGRPISSFSKRDEGWFQVAKGVRTLVAHMEPTPPLAVSRQLRTQPPTPHPASVPRPQLVAEIYRLLTGPDLSALVLTGICGLGKSALAAQVCQCAEAQRRAGQGPFLAEALWLDLDATTSLLDVCGTLCQAYGAALPSFQMMTAPDLAVALLQVLQQSQEPRLIVLNQFENWLDPQTRYPRAEHPGVGEWLELLNSQLCASRILLTSRIHPHGKSQPLDAYVQRFTPAGLTRAEGIQLLRLGEVNETEEEIASAVTYYQGHPLALALLRNLLKENRSLSLAALMQDLSYKQLLANDLAANVLRYIYTQQLNQEQRELLLAFAIYRQAVPLQEAQRIAQTRVRLPANQASAALRVLLDQDLLQAVGNLEYRLQPVINDFIQAQVREADPRLDAEHKLLAHRIAAACYQERLSRALQRAPQPSIEDFRLLLEAAWHSCQAGQFAEAYRLIHHEQLFFYLHRWGGNSLLLDLYQHLLPPEKWGADSLVAGQIYHEMGRIQNALGQKHEAQGYYQRALPFFRQTGSPVLIAEALNDLGTVHRALKEEQLAGDCYREAWSLCEQADQRFAQRGITLNNMGRLLYERGRQKQQRRQKEQAQACYMEALALYEQALAEHRSNNQPEEEGWTFLNLGDVYVMLGQRATAHDHYWQALEQFRDLGERRGEGTVLNNLGVLLGYDRAGKERTATCFIQALRIFRAVGDRWQERKTLRNLGRWLIIFAPAQDPARSQGYLRGLACFFAARDALEEWHNPRSEMIPGWLLAALRQDLGEQKTEELFQEGEARCRQIIEDLLNMPRDFL